MENAQTVTAQQAAEMLGIKYAYAHITLRANGIPYKVDRRLCHYDRSAVEQLVVHLKDIRTMQVRQSRKGIVMDSSSVQTVTTKEAAVILGVSYSSALTVLRSRAVPRSGFLYERAAVEAVVGNLHSTPTIDTAFTDWLFISDVVCQLESRLRTRITSEEVYRWANRGELRHKRDKNERLRFHPDDVATFAVPERMADQLTDSGLLSCGDAARFAKVTFATISSAASSGALPFVRVGKVRGFKEYDLLAWIEKRNKRKNEKKLPLIRKPITYKRRLEELGLIGCIDAAQIANVRAETFCRSAQKGELPFVLIHGVRAFNKLDVLAWNERRLLRKKRSKSGDDVK